MPSGEERTQEQEEATIKMEEVVEEYKSSLADLTFNSKVHISVLTMLAEDNVIFSEHIVRVIEAHLHKVPVQLKLTVLYLIDSIIKNVADSDYSKKFAKNLVANFCAVFHQVDEKTRGAMFKLRGTWPAIFPNDMLYNLDMQVRLIDPAWPVVAKKPAVEAPAAQPEVGAATAGDGPPTPTSIHVNPRFLVKEKLEIDEEKERKRQQEAQETLMRQQLLAKQQELLKLQQQRLELELAEAKSRLENQEMEIKAKEAVKMTLEVPEIEQVTEPPVVPRQDPRLNRDPRLARHKTATASSSSSLMQPVSLADVKVTAQQPILIPPQAPTPVMPDPLVPVQVVSVKSEVPIATVAPQQTGDQGWSDQEVAKAKMPAETATTSTSVKKSTSAKSSDTRSPASRDKESGSSKNKKNTPDKRDRDNSNRRSQERKRSPSRKSNRKESKGNAESERKDDKRSGKRTPTKGAKRSLDSKESSRRGSDERDSSRDGPRSKKARKGDRGSSSPTPRDQDSSKGKSDRSKADRAKRNYRARGSRGDTPDSETEVRYPGRSRSRSPHRSSRSPRGESSEGDSRGRRTSDERMPPPYHRGRDIENNNKSQDHFSEVFGDEDEDYRQLAPLRMGPHPGFHGDGPTPPLKSPSSARWSQFKAKHAESFPFQQPRLNLDMPSRDDRVHDDMLSPPLRDSFDRPAYPVSPMVMSPEAEEMNIPKPLLLDQANEILAEADQQLRSGKMSHEQHQEILKQLSELYRLQKLKLQLRENRERESGLKSPPFDGPPRGPGPSPGRAEEGLSGRSSGRSSPSRGEDPIRGPPDMLRRSTDGMVEPRISPAARVRESPCKAGLLPTPNIPPSSSSNDILRPADDDRRPRGPPLHSGPRDEIREPPLREGRPGPPHREDRPGPPHRDVHPGMSHRDIGDARGPMPPRRDAPLPPKVPLPGIRIPKKQNSPVPVPELPKFILPYNTEQFYVPLHDSRWYRPTRENKTFPSELIHEIYIDGVYYPVGLNQAPKRIQIDHGLNLTVNVDHDTKQVFINDHCYYNIGDPKRSIVIGGRSYKIMYHGPMRRIWFDGIMYDIWSDAPPTRITIDDEHYNCYIDALTGEMFLNETLICKIGFEPVACDVFGAQKIVSTTRPLKKILVDGELSEMDFRGLFPCVKIRNVERGIRFDGPPREIEIDGVPFLVNVNKGRKVQFGNVNHVIAFGGPGHEVIINGKWYECKFSGAEKDIVLGMNHHRIKLTGPPPEVKILGEFIEDKKMINKLTGNVPIDPALNLDDKVWREPPGQPKIRPRSPPPMRNSPLDPRPLDDRRSYNAPPDGHPRGPRPMMEVPPGPRFDGPVKPLLGPGPRFDGPGGPRPRLDGPSRFEGPNGRYDEPRRYDGQPDRGPPPRPGPPHYEGPDGRRYDAHEHDPRYDGPGPRYDGPPEGPHRRGYKGSLLDLPLPPESRNTPPRDLDPRGGPPPPRDPRDPRDLPPRDPRDPRRPRPDGPPGPREGPPGPGRYEGPPRYEGQGPPRYDGPDRYGPGGGPHMWPGPNGHTRIRGPPPPDQYGPGLGPRGPYRPSYPGPPMNAPGTYGGPPQGPPQPAAPVDLDGLLSNLLAKGLIGKTPASSGPPTSMPNQPPVPSVQGQPAPPQPPAFNALDFILNRSRPVQPKEVVEEIPSLTDFAVDRLKVKYKGSFQYLYSGIQCSSCGSRFTPDRVDKYREHLDWHFRQNKREKQEIKVAKFRRWYYTAQEWMQYEEFGDLEERAQSAYFEKLKNLQDGNLGAASPSTGASTSTTTVTTTSGLILGQPGSDEPISCPVASGSENDDVCDICGDTFEQFWDEDAEEWHLKDAVRVNNKTYHPTCYEDAKKTQAEPTSPATASPEVPASNPLSVLMSALNGPTSTEAPGAIPIVPMKQEVKPDLSAAATAEQQELPPAAVTATKEEVEQTPSGGATPVRDEPTEGDTKPVAPAAPVRQEPAETTTVEIPAPVTVKQEVQDPTETVKQELTEPSTPTRDEAPDDRCTTPTQDEPPSTPTQDEPNVNTAGESSSIPVVQIKVEPK